MRVKVNLRHLETKDLRLQGEVTVEELELDGVDELVRPSQPLHYDLTVQKLGHALLAQGRMEMLVECECARCLKPFPQRLKLDHWTAHVPLEGEEKAPVKDDLVDLTPYMREDILLEFPQHPLCETDCAGLPNRMEKNANSPKPGDKNSSAWAELNKLKF